MELYIITLKNIRYDNILIDDLKIKYKIKIKFKKY